MSNRAVIVGGFSTGRDVLEPVGHAVCEQMGFEDADIFEFTQVIRDSGRMERATKDAAAFVHSAGLLAVRQCVEMKSLIAINPPEPTAPIQLLGRATVKTGNLYRAFATGPNRRSVADVIASNALQTTIHLLTYSRQLKAVSMFSATEELKNMRDAGLPVARIDTDRDEFFGPYELQEWDGERLVLPGCHDQLLITPDEFIAKVSEATSF